MRWFPFPPWPPAAAINIERDSLVYRPGVGMMLINAQHQILAGKRIDMPSDAWQMPQGGIDSGEDPEAAAWRELWEEVGTDKAELITRTADWIPYEFPDDLIPKLWDGKFRGQTQIWYLMRFTGTDDDFDLDVHEREFSEIQWLDRQTLVDRVVWFKRQSYVDMLAEFAPHFPD